MPIPLAIVFRGLLFLALATHVFYMYGLARTMGESFGFEPGQAIAAALFALVMLIPLVWAVMLPDLPEIISRQVRGRHRCPSCAYSLAEATSGVCPECGDEAIEPRGYQITGRTIRRYVVLNLLAWVIGSAASEAWISADEAAFRAEVAQLTTPTSGTYIRAIRWPGRGLYYWADDGSDPVRVHAPIVSVPAGPSP